MRRATALAAAVAVVLAGCGGSFQLTAPELRLAATRICTRAESKTGAIPAPTAAADVVAYLRRGLTTMTPELNALRRLAPPASLVAEYAIAQTAFRAKLSTLRDTQKRIEHGGDPDATLALLVKELGPVLAQENTAWRTLGIPACVNH